MVHHVENVWCEFWTISLVIADSKLVVMRSPFQNLSSLLTVKKIAKNSIIGIRLPNLEHL